MIDRHALLTARTFLFVPGSRPERFDRAVAAGADVIIVDLEDAVAHDAKDAARQAAAAWFAEGGKAVIRINACGTPWHADDVALATHTVAPVMLAKSVGAQQVAAIGQATGAAVIPLVETAAGVLSARAIAEQPGVPRLAFGSIDYAAEIGVDPNDREALLFARSTLVTASAAAGIGTPLDGVTTAFRDPLALADDVGYAARLGLTGKLCIHPDQVRPVHDRLAPSAAQIEWAERIVAAASAGGAAVAVDGHMVDAPVVARAEWILAGRS